jgi:hypothetical protein
MRARLAGVAVQGRKKNAAEAAFEEITSRSDVRDLFDL